ncbi:hypothetical protein [Flagellimonas halotolerans]|uniref:Uncharacterized protein n=1 Tax=Flagellimonas halotolerans TaxID=3112164 RepID=A0ABU6IL67_9FLAO|nr:MULTISPECIES: hypothetical protein [unclassified Allomuricauda]MEC3963921.1 hypothetical protein [Muricauda sp. SYSU M86414]MEC4263791.1 hypothetical protein [Muricauda sp. SYSU M84420]
MAKIDREEIQTISQLSNWSKSGISKALLHHIHADKTACKRFLSRCSWVWALSRRLLFCFLVLLPLAKTGLFPYPKKWWGIHIGAASCFFQEGEAEKCENAKYGGLKIDAEGNSIFIGLYDDTLKKIE